MLAIPLQLGRLVAVIGKGSAELRLIAKYNSFFLERRKEGQGALNATNPMQDAGGLSQETQGSKSAKKKAKEATAAKLA